MKKRIQLSESNLKKVIREAILDELDWRTEQNAIDQRRARDINPLIKRSGDSRLSDEQKAKDSKMIKKLLARERDLQDLQRAHDQEQMTNMGLNGYERNQRKHNFRHKKAYFDKKLGRWVDPDDNQDDYVKADAEAFWRANGVRESLHRALVTEGRTSDLYNEISTALAIAQKNGNTPETMDVLLQAQNDCEDYYDGIRGIDCYGYGQKDKELLELSAQLCQLLWDYQHQGVKESKLRKAIKEAILKEGKLFKEYYLSDLVDDSAEYGMPYLTYEDEIEYLEKVIPQNIIRLSPIVPVR